MGAKTRFVHNLVFPGVLAVDAAKVQKIQGIPSQVWINLGLCVLGLVIILRLWRTLKNFNDFAPWIVSILASFMLLSYWTYNRNEPQFLSPVVDKLTLLLPTKSKHEQDLERLRKSREEH